MTPELSYEWLAPKLSMSERQALDIIYNAYIALKETQKQTESQLQKASDTGGETRLDWGLHDDSHLLRGENNGLDWGLHDDSHLLRGDTNR